MNNRICLSPDSLWLVGWFFEGGTKRIHEKWNSKKCISVQLDMHLALFQGTGSSSEFFVFREIYLVGSAYPFQTKSSVLKTRLWFGHITQLMLGKAGLLSGEVWSQMLQGNIKVLGRWTSSGSPVLILGPKKGADQGALTPSWPAFL